MADLCVVCREDISTELEEYMTLTLRCKHRFHTHCIAQWLIDEKTCPTCRNNEEALRRLNGPDYTVETYDMMHSIMSVVLYMNFCFTLLAVVAEFLVPGLIEQSLRFKTTYRMNLLYLFSMALVLEHLCYTAYPKYADINRDIQSYLYRLYRDSQIIMVAAFLQQCCLDIMIENEWLHLRYILLAVLLATQSVSALFLYYARSHYSSRIKVHVIYTGLVNLMDENATGLDDLS